MRRPDKIVEEPIKVVVKAVDQALAVNAVSRMIKDTAESLKPTPKKGALGLSFDEACNRAQIQAAAQVKTAPALDIGPKTAGIGIAR